METQKRGGKRSNSGRKAKSTESRAKSLTISVFDSQRDFVRNNGRSKLIQRLINDEMERLGMI